MKGREEVQGRGGEVEGREGGREEVEERGGGEIGRWGREVGRWRGGEGRWQGFTWHCLMFEERNCWSRATSEELGGGGEREGKGPTRFIHV